MHNISIVMRDIKKTDGVGPPEERYHKTESVRGGEIKCTQNLRPSIQQKLYRKPVRRALRGKHWLPSDESPRKGRAKRKGKSE